MLWVVLLALWSDSAKISYKCQEALSRSANLHKIPEKSQVQRNNGGDNIGWDCFFRSLNWLVLLYVSIMHKLWIIIIKTINKKTLICPNYEGRLKIWNRTSVSASCYKWTTFYRDSYLHDEQSRLWIGL